MGEPWPGAQLQVKGLHEIPTPARLCVAVPDVDQDEQEDFDNIVVDVLKCQNPHIDVDKWKIVKKLKVEGTEKVLVFFVIDTLSRRTLESKFYVNYGMRCCKVRMNSDDGDELAERMVINMTL